MSTKKPKPKPSVPSPPVVSSAAEPSGPPGSSFLIVGIGASAGGLEASTQMLQALPRDTGVAFILVQHLDPTHSSMLTEILSRAIITMPVREVTNEMQVEPNHVYVIPPGSNMVISGTVLQLSPRREVRGHHRSIDHFFRSLAGEHGGKAIGVILSGTASDGTLGLQAIKAEGGITFAQDDTAQQNSMPRSAIAAGCVDFVLPPDEIAREIARISRHPYAIPIPEAKSEVARESNLQRVLFLIRDACGVDFTHYKHNTLYRRITRRMVIHKMDGLKEYLQFLHKNPSECHALFRDILISVTSFFRNPEAFEFLKTTILPKLLQQHSQRDPLRIWIIGCSTGEEAYSIAMALSEYGEASGRPYAAQIFATDLNDHGVEKARAGIYPKNIAQDMSPERLRRFFVEVNGSYQIAKPIRDMCIFARHNVLTDPPFAHIDLLSCRNLLIYLELMLQQRLVPIIHYALEPNGFLWLGASEAISSHRDVFEAVDNKHKFYMKRPVTGHQPIDVSLIPRLERGQRRLEERPATSIMGPAEVQKQADRILLAKYVPPGVLIGADMEVLQSRGDTGLYLTLAPGKPSLNLLKMLREGLLVGVRGAILKAKREDVPVREDGLRVKSNGGYKNVNVEVIPVKSNLAQHFLILFEEADRSSSSTPTGKPIAKDKAQPTKTQEPHLSERETRLEQELGATREYLQSVIEQQEAANEELQSANEEVQSTNEELQSINEELETSKEEIQSSNEELATLNEELQHRNVELTSTNNDLLNIFSSVQMPIIILGPELRIRRFTPAAEKVLNLIPADIGRPFSDIKLSLSTPKLDQLITEVMDTATIKEQEVQDKDGRWYLLRIRPYHTIEKKIEGSVIVLMDVDALKRSQQALRTQAELLDQTYEPLFMWELNGTISYWNQGAEEAYGFTKEEAIGRNPQELLNTKPSDSFKAALEKDGRWTGELAHTRGDGREVIREARMTLVRASDGTKLVIETTRSLAGRREREELLRQRAEELVEADRNRNEFLAMLAHELRNPLAPLRMAIEVLKSPRADAQASARALDIMARQIRHMTRLVEDLLDVSRVTQRKIRLRKEPVELTAIVKQAAELYRNETEARAQSLVLTLPSQPIYLDGDSTRLEQVLSNLLSNASKFSPSGTRIEVVVGTEPATEGPDTTVGGTGKAGTSPRQAVVRIIDQGIGLAEDALPHVFDLFMQSSRSLDRSQGGLGIGLTLVKELVDLHGGTIEAHSGGVGAGSEFVVRLPILSGKFAAPSEEKLPKETFAAQPVSRRVLVVDDNVDEAKGLAMVLQMSGHQVEVAHTGDEALAATGFQPEVVVLDIGLPRMNGYEVASRLRDQPHTANVLLIALTGYGQDHDREQALESGFDFHFTKPVEPQALIELISNHPTRRS